MPDVHDLLAIPDAEIDARLARAMGWRNDGFAWYFRNEEFIEADGWEQSLTGCPFYCSESSPRSLLGEVEARIEARSKYGRIVRLLLDPNGDGTPTLPQFLMAPAAIRARAALFVLEGGKDA